MTGGGAHAGKTMKEGDKRTIPIPEWHEMALRDEATASADLGTILAELENYKVIQKDG